MTQHKQGFMNWNVKRAVYRSCGLQNLIQVTQEYEEDPKNMGVRSLN
jgi:hypothetical protein